MSVIFYHDQEQKALAEDSFQEQKKKKNVQTLILPLDKFYEAEE